ncbi:MAG TPA: CorA family divalent cation transporter, partial [Roseiflexaceae bacterium]|nr:CorA family divalent cation transporter [Roseiflexaceae bacterium]
GTLMDILSEQRASIDRLRATLDSLALQRTRASARLLLGLAVALLPAILLAAVFGMNFALPFADQALALPIAVLVVIAVAVASVAWARYRRWI